MRKQIIAGNWKMNLTIEEGYSLASEIKWMVADEVIGLTEIVIFPSFIHLSGIKSLLQDSNIKLGAQNCNQKNSGAYTGEISASMLASLGVQYVLIGHSERRQYYNETNSILATKITAALLNNLVPVYCFGETLIEREASNQFEVNKNQISEGLFHLNEHEIEKVVLAYEPVWAIGTGKTATTEQAQEMHKFIRSLIANKYGTEIANNITILYGGSMKSSNAKELLACTDIDGGLIGGAALESRSFMEIVKSV